MVPVSVFWICGSVVIPYVYSLFRYCCDFVLAVFVRLAYVGLVLHVFSSGVCLMGNARFVVVACISYSRSSKKSILATCDLMHACCFSLGRCSEPPYLAAMYLVRPWYMVPSCHGSLKACSSCCPMQFM